MGTCGHCESPNTTAPYSAESIVEGRHCERLWVTCRECNRPTMIREMA